MIGLPRMTRALTLEHASQTADGAGGFHAVWQPLGVVWAELTPGTGRDAGANGASLSRVPYRITCRAAPEGAPSRPVAGQRFRAGTRIFTIHAVTQADGAGRYLTCFAMEEIAA
jgi:head-tail adaptor